MAKSSTILQSLHPKSHPSSTLQQICSSIVFQLWNANLHPLHFVMPFAWVAQAHAFLWALKLKEEGFVFVESHFHIHHAHGVPSHFLDFFGVLNGLISMSFTFQFFIKSKQSALPSILNCLFKSTKNIKSCCSQVFAMT